MAYRDRIVTFRQKAYKVGANADNVVRCSYDYDFQNFGYLVKERSTIVAVASSILLLHAPLGNADYVTENGSTQLELHIVGFANFDQTTRAAGDALFTLHGNQYMPVRFDVDQGTYLGVVLREKTVTAAGSVAVPYLGYASLSLVLAPS